MNSGLSVPASRMARRIDAGHRADVRAAVPADLGLVAHAADRDALELAAQRLGDRLPERGLADAGRPDEAEDRPVQVVLQLAHGEELEDAVLDLLEVVVVAVEDLARVLEVEVVLARRVPGQRQDPVEVRADHAVLGALRRDARRAAPARAGRPSATSSGSSSCVELLAQLVRSRPPARWSPPSSCWIAFSCWRRKYSRWLLSISDCTCALDLRAELEHLELAGEDRRSASRSRASTSSPLEQLLLLLGLDAQGRGDEEGRARSGSSTLAAAISSSSGRYGTSSTIFENEPCTLARERVELACSSSDVGPRLSRSRRRGRAARARSGSTRTRAMPCTRMRMRPVGQLDHLVGDARRCRSS